MNLLLLITIGAGISSCSSSRHPASLSAEKIATESKKADADLSKAWQETDSILVGERTMENSFRGALLWKESEAAPTDEAISALQNQSTIGRSINTLKLQLEREGIDTTKVVILPPETLDFEIKIKQMKNLGSGSFEYTPQEKTFSGSYRHKFKILYLNKESKAGFTAYPKNSFSIGLVRNDLRTLKEQPLSLKNLLGLKHMSLVSENISTLTSLDDETKLPAPSLLELPQLRDFIDAAREDRRINETNPSDLRYSFDIKVKEDGREALKLSTTQNIGGARVAANAIQGTLAIPASSISSCIEDMKIIGL